MYLKTNKLSLKDVYEKEEEKENQPKNNQPGKNPQQIPTQAINLLIR